MTEPAPTSADVWTPRRLHHLAELAAGAMYARTKPLQTHEIQTLIAKALEVDFSATGKEGGK